ncbi:MAG: hypothetical protein ACOYK6_06170 [Chthoniobacterales bacterium]
MGTSMNVGNRIYPSAIGGNGSLSQKTQGKTQGSEQAKNSAVQVGDHYVKMAQSGRSEDVLNAIKNIEKLFKGRELIGAGVVAERSLGSDEGASLVRDIRAAIKEILKRTTDEIKATHALGHQTSVLYTSSLGTEQYLNSNDTVKAAIDGHASSLEKSQKALEAAQKEGESLLESPPSLSDLPQQFHNLNEARNKVEIEAGILLGSLVVIGVPEALALVKGIQVTSNKASQSAGPDENESQVGDFSSLRQERGAVGKGASGVLGKRGRGEDKKLEEQETTLLFDTKKESTQEILEKAKKERKKEEERFFENQGNAKVAQRSAGAEGMVREF